MNFYDAIREISASSGVSEADACTKIGKNRSYISSSRSRGSAPKVDNAAVIVEAFGWKLVAVPDDDVPDNAVMIDNEHDETDAEEKMRQIAAMQRKLESLKRRGDDLQRQSEELQKRLGNMGQGV